MRTLVRQTRNADDRKLIIHIVRQCFDRSDWFSLKNIQGETCFLLFMGDELAGLTVLHEGGFWDWNRCEFVEHRDYLYIICTAILPRFQNIGLGRFFKSWQIAYAIAKNFRTIRTITRESNIRMLGLNRKFGFKRVRLLKDFYHDPNEDGIGMELSV